jgi:hypothetical protein
MNHDVTDPEFDRTLRAAFAPPEAAEFAALAAAALAAERQTPRWPWLRWPALLAAAALCVVAALWWSMRPPLGPEGHDGQQLGALWATAFRDAERQGFGMGCCNAALDVKLACRERFGSALELERGARLQVLGTYAGQPTGGGMALLAQAGSQPVCVCVLPAARDPRVQLPKDSGLVLGRRQVGELVVYAVSVGEVREALAGFVVP